MLKIEVFNIFELVGLDLGSAVVTAGLLRLMVYHQLLRWRGQWISILDIYPVTHKNDIDLLCLMPDNFLIKGRLFAGVEGLKQTLSFKTLTMTIFHTL